MPARGEVKGPEGLGRMLQQGRMVSGLTQRELAEKLETDQKYIWALESGKNAIILERIFEIMRETWWNPMADLRLDSMSASPPPDRPARLGSLWSVDI